MTKNKLYSQSFPGKSVVVIGGSKGMGLSIAKKIFQLGGNVCLIARGREALDSAAKEISSIPSSTGQFVESICCDATAMDRLKPELELYIETRGVPDYLLNVAGYAYPQYIEKLTLENFRQNMDVNYYSQLVPILILLPYFLKQKRGYIVNFSSVLGYLGMMGYATYVPTKYAIFGLSETLRNELKPYNINVSVVFPPDTDTPGFQHENETKPPETAMMSGNAKLMQPDDLARVVLKSILKKKFTIFPGNSGFIYLMTRLFPNLVRFILDRDLKKYRKKVQNQKS